MPRPVLILFADPMPRKSRAKRVLAATACSPDGGTFRGLGEAHLDFEQLPNPEDADAT